MSSESAEQIVLRALQNRAMDKLLLGEPSYSYVPHGSPTPDATDVIELLHALYRLAEAEENAQILRDALTSAIRDLEGSCEGIEPLVSVVFFEAFSRNKHRFNLDLPLEAICSNLAHTIAGYCESLVKDRTGAGQGFTDGRYGNLRRMNKIIADCNGPSILS